ncbi:MAG: hypothetical protein ACOC2H_01730 [Spirochaetota bacterium]
MAGKSDKSAKKYTEKQILNSKTPEEYIDRSLNSDIPRGRKTVLCRMWKEQTGYTTEDIQHARNRHPFWKNKKMAGWQERNQRRWSEHDYREEEKSSIEPFDDDRISSFYDLNRKDKNGRYVHKDWEIARELKITIPAVQHWRRKLLLVYRLLEAENKKATKKTVLQYLKRHENGLRRAYKELIR